MASPFVRWLTSFIFRSRGTGTCLAQSERNNLELIGDVMLELIVILSNAVA